MKKPFNISMVGWLAIWCGLGLIYFAPFGCLCGTQQPPKPTCQTNADCQKGEKCTGGTCVFTPPVSHCPLQKVVGYCIEYTGEQHESATNKEECTRAKGTLRAGLPCPVIDLIGKCGINRKDGSALTHYYYTSGSPPLDETKAKSICSGASGIWQPIK